MPENNKVTETVEVEGEIPRDYQIEWLPESIRIAISKHVLGYYSTASIYDYRSAYNKRRASRWIAIN